MAVLLSLKVVPVQGMLSAYESKEIEVSFTPRVLKASQGWSHHQGQYAKREYVVFVRFSPVGVSHDGFQGKYHTEYGTNE